VACTWSKKIEKKEGGIFNFSFLFFVFDCSSDFFTMPERWARNFYFVNFSCGRGGKMLEMPWNRLPWRVRAPFKTNHLKNKIWKYWVFWFSFFKNLFFKKNLQIYTAFFFFSPLFGIILRFFWQKKKTGKRERWLIFCDRPW